MSIRTAVVVGNPRPASRTLAAATYVAQELTSTEPDLVVDLATLGAALVDWADPTVDELVTDVAGADLVVVACPTYKATYTGLLKLFLDRFAAGQLRGVAVPLMLGAGPGHALAPEWAGASADPSGRLRADRRPLRPGPAVRRPGGLRRLAAALAARRDRPARTHPTPRSTGVTAVPSSLRRWAGSPPTRTSTRTGFARRSAFFPSGVVAVAAEVDGALVGLAASSFTSVSLDPPLVSFSIAKTSKTWPDLRRATHVGVTVLAEHHGDVCRQLAGPVDHRFDEVPVRVTDDGAVLLEEGLARFDFSLYREVEAGDHTIILLRLHGVEHDAEAQLPGSPLVFHRSAFGRLSRAKAKNTQTTLTTQTTTPEATPLTRETR